MGRGFTLDELKGAGLKPEFAKNVGIAVDFRRTNKCEESLNLNIERLKQYKSRLVVFPRNSKADVPQLSGEILPIALKAEPVTYVALTDVIKTKFSRVFFFNILFPPLF